MPHIDTAWKWAVNTCEANNVGYSQAYRNAQTVNGITYYDCSSFINYALLAGGFSTPGYAPNSNAFTTWSMGQVLLNLGFHKVTDGSLKPGDIGVSNNSSMQHTEMVYQVSSDGKTAQWMGAHTDSYSLPNQVSITSYWSKLWFDTLYRYENGATGSDPTPEDKPNTGLRVSVYVIAAMCGNFWTESSINPGIWESLNEQTDYTVQLVGYGLGQWTNTGGNTHGRLYSVMKYLSDNGYPKDSGIGEMEFLMQENYWSHASDYGFGSLREFLTSDSTDIAMLTHAFNWCWEGIHNSSWDARVTQAQQCYNYIIAHKDDSSITGWIAGNRFLSTDERLNNAVMIYRWISTNGEFNPVHVNRKKKKDIILMLRSPLLYD